MHSAGEAWFFGAEAPLPLLKILAELVGVLRMNDDEESFRGNISIPSMSGVAQFIAIAFVGMVAVATLAQEPVEPGPGPRTPPWTRRTPNYGVSRQISPLVEVLDANHDGIIDAAELANATSALLALDKNDDGSLTKNEYSELSPSPARPNRWRLPSRFALKDPASLPPQGGLENFGVVDEHVLRGAQPSTTGIQILKALGVTTIINLKLASPSLATEQAEAIKYGMTCTNIPMDALDRPAAAQVEAALAAIANSGGKVFIHCQAGRDRTGTIVACYRIVHDQWSNEQALQEANTYHMSRDAAELRTFVADFGKTRVPSSPGAPVP